jgi:hypothetical protein
METNKHQISRSLFALLLFTHALTVSVFFDTSDEILLQQINNGNIGLNLFFL